MNKNILEYYNDKIIGTINNTKYNQEGKAVVELEDEWREETEWDAMFEQMNKERKP